MSANRALRLLVPLVFLLPGVAISQKKVVAPSTPAGCPVELTDFHPTSTAILSAGLGVRVKNLSAKEIDGRSPIRSRSAISAGTSP